jgi:fatty-acyl-CoA synthase
VTSTVDPATRPAAVPTERRLPLRPGDFATLLDALDYASGAGTGASFHDGRGRLEASLGWGRIRQDAEQAALRLAALGLARGTRVGIVADTHPDFLVSFFACRLAALVPVPLPASIHMGGHRHYVDLLGRLLAHAEARACLASSAFAPYLAEADPQRALAFRGSLAELAAHDPAAALPERPAPEELAYVQYTSGSTRFPRGAMLTERATLRNVRGIVEDGLAIREGDRFCSWLPIYHDMGLVGKVLVPMASQTSIDYLGTREFAMRPRLWPRLLTDQGGTISFAPPFGYELTARRLRPGDAESFDLSAWRIAGCGADMIRPEVLERFAEALAPGGFDPRALTPSYGMAEVSLAVSFTPLGRGLEVDRIDAARRERDGEAVPVGADADGAARFTVCGTLLPGYRVEIRDEAGAVLPERRVGSVFLDAPSTMEGYLDPPGVDRSSLHEGWLDTGDLGYLVGGRLVITGRRKDLMIINGRNLWPQDVEFLTERREGLRTGDAAAFTVEEEEGPVLVVLLQCREQNEAARERLLRSVRSEVQAEFGVEARVVAVAPHSLPRTTSGKLSRAKARLDFLAGAFETP